MNHLFEYEIFNTNIEICTLETTGIKSNMMIRYKNDVYDIRITHRELNYKIDVVQKKGLSASEIVEIKTTLENYFTGKWLLDEFRHRK